MKQRSLKYHSLTQAGFTLIEVAAALALLAILITLVYGSVTHAVRVRNKLETAVRKFETVQGLLERIRSDLQGAYGELKISTARGEKGEPHWVIYLDDKEGRGAPADRFVFTTLSHREYFLEGDDHNVFSHVEIGYELLEPEDDEDDNTYDMIRRSDVTMDNDPLEGGKSYKLAGGLRGFNVRLYNGVDKGWEDSWDSRDKPDVFPEAAEITIWYGGTEDDQDSWIPVALLVPLRNRNFGLVKNLRDVRPKKRRNGKLATSGGKR